MPFHTINATGQVIDLASARASTERRKGSQTSIFRSNVNASQLSLKEEPMLSNSLPMTTSSHTIISKPPASSEVLKATLASSIPVSTAQVHARRLKEPESPVVHPPRSSDGTHRGERLDERNTSPTIIANLDIQKPPQKVAENSIFGAVHSSDGDASARALVRGEIASQVSAADLSKSGGNKRQDVISRRADTGNSFVTISTPNGHSVAERLTTPKTPANISDSVPTNKFTATQVSARREIVYRVSETHPKFIHNVIPVRANTDDSPATISSANGPRGTERSSSPLTLKSAASVASKTESCFATPAPAGPPVAYEGANANNGHSPITSIMTTEKLCGTPLSASLETCWPWEMQRTIQAPKPNSPPTTLGAVEDAHECGDVRNTRSTGTDAKNDHAPFASRPLMTQEFSIQFEAPKSARISNRSPHEHAPETATKGSASTSQVVNAITGVRKDDIIIAFMGPTGTGKSFFIDLLTGQQGKRAGSTLKSVTSEIQATRVRHPRYGDRIILVDTPGFDDTTMSDMEILRMIGHWLEKTYEKSVKLSGIVYLHRITDNRMAGSPHKNLRMFGELCGDVAMNQVILLSTFWQKIQQDIGERRERELKECFWGPLIKKGSRVDRLKTGTEDEAWRIVYQLIKEREDREAVLLQEELVDLGKQLAETQAGRALYSDLQKLLADQKDSIKSLLEQVDKSNDPALAKELKKEYAKIEEQFQKTFDEVKKLKVPLGKRIMLLFFGKKTRAKAVKIAAA